MIKRKHIESREEIHDRILELCEPVDCGIFAPPLDGQKAFNELCRFILGDDWYTANPVPQKQVNPEMLYDAECRLRKIIKQPRKEKAHD